MNEPRVFESVTNECQSLGRAHESSSARAEQLIACLEGEIAKRDETIARLEPQLNRAIQANYDLREELAACRIAVENCDLFRARIAELEDDLKCAHSMLCEVSKSGMVLRAELAALKAQEPVAFVHFCDSEIDYDSAYVISNETGDCVDDRHEWRPVYAAPVSEAKAQGVVMPPSPYMPGSQPTDFTDYELGEIHGRIAMWEEVKRLNAAPVQQVSVPDVSAMARILADRNADACNVNREDNWAIYGQDYIDYVTAMLAAAPAAQAADAGLVWALERIAGNAASHIEQGKRPDLVTVSHWAGVAYSAIDAHRAKGVV